MPIYDYRCGSCGRRFSVLFRSFGEVREPACEHCGAFGAARLPSRVRLVRSEEDRLENIADPSGLGDVDESDPRSVARWARTMGKELGEDVGDEFDEAMEAMEAGESPGDADGGTKLDDDGDDDDL